MLDHRNFLFLKLQNKKDGTEQLCISLCNWCQYFIQNTFNVNSKKDNKLVFNVHLNKV